MSNKFLVVGVCSLFLSVVCVAFTANAQTAEDLNRARAQSDQLQRERQLREQDIKNRALEQQDRTYIEVPEPPTPQGQGEGCLQIEQIVLLNKPHMNLAQEKDLIRSYVGTCMGVEDIQNILSDITRFYVDKGYVTTRAYLPAQDLTSGTLQIDIVAGKIGAIETEEGSRILRTGNFFPKATGKDLNLRDIEQAIDQLNRLRSNNVSLDLRPGENAGESIIFLNNKPGKQWHLSLSADNYGSKTTGRYQSGATIGLDNLIGFNEFYSITQKYTMPLNDPDKQSKSTSFLFTVPYGYTTFTAGLNFSDYDSRLITPGGSNFHLSGNNKTIYTTLDHVLYRDQTDKLSAHLTMTRDKVGSFIDGEELSVSSRTLSYLEAGVDYQTILFDGNVNAGMDYVRGLSWFNALNDAPSISGDFPHAQFEKYTLDAGYSRYVEVAEKNVSVSTQFSGQYAPHVLYGSQQFSVGGIYSVRGFYEEALANDIGFSLRNDVTLYENYVFQGEPVAVQPFVAFDTGAVASRHSGADTGMMGGVAAGFAMQYKDVSFDFYMGHPLFYPDSVDDEGFNSFARISIGL